MTESRFNEIVDNWLGHLLADVCPFPMGSDEEEKYIEEMKKSYRPCMAANLKLFQDELLGVP